MTNDTCTCSGPGGVNGHEPHCGDEAPNDETWLVTGIGANGQFLFTRPSVSEAIKLATIFSEAGCTNMRIGPVDLTPPEFFEDEDVTFTTHRSTATARDDGEVQA